MVRLYASLDAIRHGRTPIWPLSTAPAIYLRARDEIRARTAVLWPTGGESLSSHSGGVRNYEK